MNPTITAQNINKSYGDLEVLVNVNLIVEPREIVAIVGPSGAGKTTLLHILGTLDRPNVNAESKLIIEETNATNLTEKELAKFRNQNLGFVFQFHELLPEFTALENVCLPMWIGQKDSKIAERNALELLSKFGLKDRIHHKPMKLSGGEQQRVAVARALINKPKIIFADEPTGNLDSTNAELLHDLFFELRDQLGCSFVIVTHNSSLANRADRTIFINDGKIQK